MIDFFIVPVDKARNNFTFVCNKFYIEVSMNELGTTSNKIIGNNVYKHVKMSSTRFFKQQ